MKELRDPDDFVASAPDAETQGSMEPTYEEMRQDFSIGFEGKHGKVGNLYIRVETPYIQTRLRTPHCGIDRLISQ